MTREQIEDIGHALSGTARVWWEDYGDTFEDFAEAEARDVFRALERSKTDAKLVIASQMGADDFMRYMKRTTAELRGVARRRADVLDALEDLGLRAARVLAGIVLSKI